MVTTKDIRVLTLNVLATTDDFMSVDRKAFKTAVWEALDGTKKNQLFFSYMIACAMLPSSQSAEINFRKYDPLLWWRNHESYIPTIRKKGCARGGVASHERLHWQMYIFKAKFKLNWSV